MDSMGSLCLYLGLIFLGIGNLGASPPAGINWFKGDVEDAFKAAKSSGRPLFLYWGARWCPPCIKMTKTVFSKPLFREKIKGFIPIYFDGDQDRAQIWGEKLKSKGYPTLMIFNSDGQEIMRLPIDVSVEQYAKLLDAALKGGAKSIGQILKLVKTSSLQKISRQDWSMLAGHAWFQDKVLGLSKAQKREVLKDLLKKVPVAYKEERYRFFLLYLSVARESSDKLRQYVSLLEELLRDRTFIQKNFGDVILKLPSIVLKIYAGRTSGELVVAEKRLLEISSRMRGTREERLLGLYPTLVFKKGGLPASFEGQLLRAVAEVDRSVTDREERQSIMSTAVQLLMMAELVDKARDYAVKEIKKSASPWYFMGVAADIEEKRGDFKMALEWGRKSWSEAKGANTRFARGGAYLLKLLSLSAKDVNTIHGAFEKVLKEILEREDAFSGRNRDVFERLGKAVSKWESKSGRRKLWRNIQKVCKDACAENMRGWGFAR